MFIQLNNVGCNLEHTCWYSPQTIKELLRRYNFKVEKIHYGGKYFPIKRFKPNMLLICKKIQ